MQNKLISDCAKYISSTYPKSLILNNDYSSLFDYINKYVNTLVLDRNIDKNELTENIYNELCKYSILTKYIENEDVNEININSYKDIFVSYSSKNKIEKISESFSSPEHALTIVRRILSEKGNIIDYSNPISSSYIENDTGNIRITSILPPLINKENGISASIRILHPKKIDLAYLIKSEYITSEASNFLLDLLKYGISIAIAGKTNSGKTTLLSSLLNEIKKDKRIFIIEEGAREILNKENDTDNIISTLTKHSSSLSIKQDDLLMTSLRFNPDIIALGEMRTDEAHACIEASLTGHTVISTLHSGPCEYAHMRMSLLSQRKFNIDIHMSIYQARLAFPVIVYTHMLDNGHRQIMDISEYDFEKERYIPLFSYDNKENKLIKMNDISPSLKSKMENYGYRKEEQNT